MGHRMGAAATCCLGEAACCAAGQVITCCGRALQCSGAMGYPIVVFIGTLLSIVVRYALIGHLDTLLHWMGGDSSCNDVQLGDAKQACFGNQFVYRLGFSLVLFFSLMFVLVPCFRKAIHDGSWLLKTTIILATFIGSLWMNDDNAAGFASVCLYGSALFIIIQVLILLEFVYAWNENWRDKAQEDESFFKYLMGSTIMAYLASITFIVLSIVQFGAGGCSFAIAQISWTTVACVLFSVISITISEHGSLLCSSMVTLYCCFYCWSALTGMDPGVTDDAGNKCNTLLSDSGSSATTVNVVFGLILTCLSLAGSAYSSGEGVNDLTTMNSKHTTDRAYKQASKDPEAGGDYEQMEGGGDQADWDFGSSELVQPLMTYHFIMVVCVMYMVMTVVNWDVDVTSEHAKMENFGTGPTVVWVKTLGQWLTIVLYTWTLVAPKVLEACGVEREFDFS